MNFKYSEPHSLSARESCSNPLTFNRCYPLKSKFGI